MNTIPLNARKVLMLAVLLASVCFGVPIGMAVCFGVVASVVLRSE